MIIRSALILILNLLLLACSTVTEEKTIDDSRAIKGELLIQDGAWCWFSDPRAVYHRGAKEQIYFGYINSSGDVCIGSKDLESEQLNQFVLHDTLEIDDHNVPSILVLPNGKLLAFYNEHNGNVYLRKSANSEDISSWEGSRIVARETEYYNYCYTNPVQLKEENGRIYLIGRKVGPTRSFDHWWQYMKYSDDEGQTWSDDIVLLDNEGRKNPPYLKVATDHQSRIDFLFTDGHPKIGSDVSVYHMYYDEGVFFQTNGDTLAGLDQLPIPIASVNKLYDASETNTRAWIWDIALDRGHPVITYSRYPTEDDHIYHYVCWQNGEWVDREVVNSGSWIASLRQGDVVREAHYSGGIVLDQQDPRHIYLARETSGKFEIEHRQLQPDGQWTTSLITARSSANNVDRMWCTTHLLNTHYCCGCLVSTGTIRNTRQTSKWPRWPIEGFWVSRVQSTGSSIFSIEVFNLIFQFENLYCLFIHLLVLPVQAQRMFIIFHSPSNFPKWT